MSSGGPGADSDDSPDLRQRKSGFENNNAPASAQPPLPDQPNSQSNTNIFTPPEYHNYGCGEAYAQAVRTWLWAYHSWQMAQAMAPFYIHQMMQAQNPAMCQPTTMQQVPGTSPTSAAAIRTTVTTGNADTPQARPQGSQHIIASYGRRLLAELIDFSFCFVLKLLIVYFMVELNFIDIEKYEKLLGDQADLKTFIDITQDLFPVEVANKIVTSFLESLYITYGWGSVPPGFTPGKFVLGLKVIACDKVHALAPRDYRVIVEGEKPVPFQTSFMRSFIKNFSLSFLFPLCVTMYAFRFNRSLYDIASGTVVVEAPQRG